MKTHDKREVREKCNIADLKDVRGSGKIMSIAFRKFRAQGNFSLELLVNEYSPVNVILT